ncbi:PD40 domain-containing protein [bacterium]|nr:PD40 domain-containing protein [bacterium]
MFRLRFGVVILGIVFTINSCDSNPPTEKFIDLTRNQVDILFVSENSGAQRIYAVQDTTFDQVYSLSLGNNNGTLDPSWSPDGRKFAYTNMLVITQTGYPFHSNIYIVNMDSFNNAFTQVTLSPYVIDSNGIHYGTINMRPDWSLQTNKVVFISDRDSVFNIFITDISDTLTGDTLPTVLTDINDKIDIFCYPSFSPDGSKIVYTSKKSGNEEIWIMNSDGSNKVQLTHNNATLNSRPRFSPSADRISFFSSMWINGNDSLQVYTMDPNGSNLDTVTTSGNNYDPSWSPDGNEIVFAKRGGSPSKPRSYIYIIGRNGLNERKLISGDNKAYYPAWRPQP